jgi:hypothetical protein
MAATTINRVLNVSIRESERSTGPRRLTIALVVVALLFVAVVSVYMVQMPGSLSSMLASMF